MNIKQRDKKVLLTNAYGYVMKNVLSKLIFITADKTPYTYM